MKKLLISFFAILSLFFLVSPTFAQEKCTFTCPDGTAQINPTECAASPGEPVQNLEASCPALKTPSDPNDLNNCICNPVQAPVPPARVAPAAGAAAPEAPAEPKGCTGSDDPNCTKGSGKPCSEGTSDGIETAIGCIPTEPRELINGLLRFGTFAAGGVAFLLMILASLEMITAEGSAEVIKKAQEKFYSAIIGLLLIIFSVLLMQIIGVDVLGLPGFGK